MRAIAVFLLAGALGATTITDDIRDAAGNKLSGSCTIQTLAQFASPANYRVVGVPYTVNFISGDFSAVLTPTDTAVPGPTYYRVGCSAKSTAGRTQSWGPEIWSVPTTGSVLTIADVLVTSTILYYFPATTGRYCFDVSGQQVTRITCPTGGGSMPSTFDSAPGLFDGAPGLFDGY